MSKESLIIPMMGFDIVHEPMGSMAYKWVKNTEFIADIEIISCFNGVVIKLLSDTPYHPKGTKLFIFNHDCMKLILLLEFGVAKNVKLTYCRKYGKYGVKVC